MKPRMASASEERSSQQPKRKAYQKPRLHVYGDLADITQGKLGGRSNDGLARQNKQYTA
jgi:hypothetical protein